MLLFDVTLKFDAAVKVICKRQHVDELVAFCRDHEKRPVVLNNLCEQVLMFEKRFAPHANAKPERLNEIIATVAYQFVRAIKAQRDEQLMSEAAKAEHINPDLSDIESAMVEVNDRTPS